MAGPQEFTCRECGAQFDSRDKLDKHNRREHSVNQADGGSDAGQQGRGRSQRRSEPSDEDVTG